MPGSVAVMLASFGPTIGELLSRRITQPVLLRRWECAPAILFTYRSSFGHVAGGRTGRASSRRAVNSVRRTPFPGSLPWDVEVVESRSRRRTASTGPNADLVGEETDRHGDSQDAQPEEPRRYGRPRP